MRATFTWITGLIIFALSLLYRFVTKKYQYWSSRGIDGPKPIPFFGNIWTLATEPLVNYETRWTQQFGKLYGTYIGFEPILTVMDNELIKQVMVKDFPLFVNRRDLSFRHEILSESLFELKDEKWKTVRSITSPTFTSGKLKSMLWVMDQCVDKLCVYLDKRTSSGGNARILTKEVINGFTIDVISTTSFATETNANDDRSKDNPVLVNATNFFNFNPLTLICILIFPLWINDLLGIKSASNMKSVNFFLNLMKQILKQRTVDKVKRNDLVQLLLDASVDENELRNSGYENLTATMEHEEENSNSKLKPEVSASPSSKRKLTENEIIAQCVLFFSAGFETTGSTITYLLYEMATNPEIQQRLVDEFNEKLSGITDTSSEQFYDVVMTKIPYLDAVIKETLRKYPPVARVERRVSVNGYKLGNLELSKNQLVEVPVYAIHHTEEYYPDPERYNPDRFLPENKDQLVPYTYLPFGTGPRNCVGMRFAYQEIKLFLARIIPRYQFEPCDDTPYPIKFLKGAILLNPAPIPINVCRRSPYTLAKVVRILTSKVRIFLLSQKW